MIFVWYYFTGGLHYPSVISEEYRNIARLTLVSALDDILVADGFVCGCAN